ncbi:MAG: pyridoxal-phosphate dependent enzyme, partial [Halobacteriales archaeon]|nr:pyridoxal-phosphate dependent enzyme [Halobacteriales archaeon]
DVPTRVAGQKTLAYEVVGTLGHAPEAMVLPVSSGGNASAVWKAFQELSRAGVITEIPRLYFIQADACDPIAQAFRTDEKSVRPTVADETIAYSIANPDPPSGNRALAAARDTGGAVLSVGDAAIREAQSTIATHTGLAVEPASATTIAGIRRLTTDGTIATDDHVVAVATGTGYREEPGGTSDSSIVSLDDLKATLSSRGPT